MQINAETKQLINEYINILASILYHHDNDLRNNELYQTIRNEINNIHELYKKRNKIFNLIYAYPVFNPDESYAIHIGVEEHLLDSKEINDYIIDCIDAYYLLHKL